MPQAEKSLVLLKSLKAGEMLFTQHDFSEIRRGIFEEILQKANPRSLVFKGCIFHKSVHKSILTSAGREAFPADTKFIDSDLSGYKIEEEDIPYLEKKGFYFKYSTLKWPDGMVTTTERREEISNKALQSLINEIKELVRSAKEAQEDEITQLLTDLKRLKKTDPFLRRKLYITAIDGWPTNIGLTVNEFFIEAKAAIIDQRGIFGSVKNFFRDRSSSAERVAQRFLDSQP
jgi:hypothetical protein